MSAPRGKCLPVHRRSLSKTAHVGVIFGGHLVAPRRRESHR